MGNDQGDVSLSFSEVLALCPPTALLRLLKFQLYFWLRNLLGERCSYVYSEFLT
jgi:hypothetical protein